MTTFLAGVAIGATIGVIYVVAWSIVAVTSDIEAGTL